jgi:hypothetical protein
MQDIGESLTSEILSHVATADRWLLQFVCKQFRAIVRPTLHHCDPRRRRVLDDILEYAVANGGVATVRFLFDKKSHVWDTAVAKAASNGDLETVRLVVERGSARRAMMAALDGGHLHVAEYLFPRIQMDDHVFVEMFDSSVKSRNTLEWTVSKMPSSFSSSSVKKYRMTHVFVKACCDSGNLECVEYLCEFFGKERIFYAIFDSPQIGMPYFALGKRFVPVSVLRYLGSAFGYRLNAKQVPLIYSKVPFDHKNSDVLDYLLETQGFDAMQTAAAANVYVYAFLAGKGLIARTDLAAAASDVKYAHHLEVLMKLYPDPYEWTKEAGLVQRLLQRGNFQAALGKFFRSQNVNFHFEIKCGDKTAVDALRAMGGKCTSNTFCRVVCVSDDVEHARSVWEAMDAQERDKFRSTTQNCLVGAMDLGMLEFVALELDAADRLRDMNLVYSGQRSRFTVALARFILEHRNTGLSTLLTEAVLCTHLDVVEAVARASTRDELWKCMWHLQLISAPINADLFRAISRAILEKTRPVWRWLARWKLSKCQSRLLGNKNGDGFSM